jgi:hypothetical protein
MPLLGRPTYCCAVKEGLKDALSPQMFADLASSIRPDRRPRYFRAGEGPADGRMWHRSSSHCYPERMGYRLWRKIRLTACMHADRSSSNWQTEVSEASAVDDGG